MGDQMGVGGGSPFPALDPIPLPAPGWLFKVLLDLTLSLHFTAVQLLIGAMLIGIYLDFSGRRAGRADKVETAAGLASWLTVIMTYVINLGVPPLLFCQVLYGRALYTSSVLIGPYWIAVIPLLIICYQLLYTSKARASEGRPWWGLGLLAAVVALGIAKIYSVNMTLMLKPELWSDLYRANQTGLKMPSGELPWLARWLMMIASSLTAAGVMLNWLSLSPVFGSGARRYQASIGPRLGVVGAILSVVIGFWVWSTVPEAVRATAGGTIWTALAVLWIAVAALTIAANAYLAAARPSLGWPLLSGISTVVFLNIAAVVVCRDFLRDAYLKTAGFDVWERATSVNWSVLLLFFALFVIGLGFAGWLASVALGASFTKGESAA